LSTNPAPLVTPGVLLFYDPSIMWYFGGITTIVATWTDITTQGKHR
jgi:hypothetical protein